MKILVASIVTCSTLLLSPLSAAAATIPYTGLFTLSQSYELPVSYHLDQNHGGLRVIFLGYERFKATNGLASTSPLTKWGGVFVLSYSACANTYCANPRYPAMTTELWPGQSTTYLNYNVTLDSLSPTKAAVTVTTAQ